MPCMPTKLVYGATGLAEKNFSHCSGRARRTKSASDAGPHEAKVGPPGWTVTRMASPAVPDCSPMVTGS